MAAALWDRAGVGFGAAGVDFGLGGALVVAMVTGGAAAAPQSTSTAVPVTRVPLSPAYPAVVVAIGFWSQLVTRTGPSAPPPTPKARSRSPAPQAELVQSISNNEIPATGSVQVAPVDESILKPSKT